MVNFGHLWTLAALSHQQITGVSIIVKPPNVTASLKKKRGFVQGAMDRGRDGK
jgi:hypothetical protein